MQADPSPAAVLVQILDDRVRHGVIFCEATLRVLNELLALLDAEKEALDGECTDHDA
jgi:hypothetical protein